MTKFKGTKGDDHFKGTKNADSFDLSQGGNDRASGGGGNDIFSFKGAFTAKDQIDGGKGTDTVSLAGDYTGKHAVTFAAITMVNVETIKLGAHHSYKLTTSDATVAAGKTLTVDGSKLGIHDVLTFNGSHETNGQFDLIGGKGNDALTGGKQGDIFDLAHGGNDTATGGAGDDTFNMAAALTAADRINGGTGEDVLNLDGSYNLTLGANTIRNIGYIYLTGAHNYTITTNNANVASGFMANLDATAVDASHHVVFDQSAETDGSICIWAGQGGDTITVGSAEVFLASNPETINGEGGNDTVILNGPGYGAPITLGSNSFVSVETLTLGAGHSYDLIEDNGNVAAGESMTVAASALGSGDSVTFDGHNETDGSFDLIGGAGNDTLYGGDQDDLIDLTHGGTDTAHGNAGDDIIDMGTFRAGVTVDGGTNADTLKIESSGGNDTLTLSGSHISGIETVKLSVGTDFAVVAVDSTLLGSGQSLTIDGSALTGDNVAFDTTGNSLGTFTVEGGAGDDTLIATSANLDNGLTFAGGDGYDTLKIDGTGASDTLTADLTDFTSLNNIIFQNAPATLIYDITLADTTADAAASLAIDSTNLDSTDSLIVDGSAVTDFHLNVTVASAEADITGGSTFDEFNFTGAASVFAGSTVDGGGGGDHLNLNGGDYSGGVTLSGANISNVAEIDLLHSGNAYVLTTDNALVANGATLTVDGSLLDSSSPITFDGGAETDGKFVLKGGAGNDHLIGGAKNDTFTGGGGSDYFDLSHGGADTATGGDGDDTFYMGAALTSADSINGAGSAILNILELAGDYTAGNALTISSAFVTHIDDIQLDDGFSYHLTLSAGLGVGQVSGGAINAGHSMYVDGSALTTTLGFSGGGGDDTLIGGSAIDVIIDGGGDNTITGNGSGDQIAIGSNCTLVYNAQSDSHVSGSPLGADQISNCDLSANVVFDVSTVTGITGGVSGVDPAVTTGTLNNSASFATNLEAAIDNTKLLAHDAVLFTPDAGTAAGTGYSYLIVDVNGTAGFQHGSDIVIELFQPAGTLTAANFS